MWWHRIGRDAAVAIGALLMLVGFGWLLWLKSPGVGSDARHAEALIVGFRTDDTKYGFIPNQRVFMFVDIAGLGRRWMKVDTAQLRSCTKGHRIRVIGSNNNAGTTIWRLPIAGCTALPPDSVAR